MEFALAVFGKVMDISFGVAKREMSYMWNYSENVEKLKNEAEMLTQMKARLEQQIDLARTKGEVLVEGLEAWLNNAHVNIYDATTFLNQEDEAKNLRSCVNFKNLHHYGKKATKKTCDLVKHREDGKVFETCVAHPAPTPGFADIYPGENLENMDTQKKILKEVIGALEDDEIQIVGITGVGGVGKTTLASEVAKQMKNQFAEIVFIAISQTIDEENIREKVDKVARRIMNGDKVLIILDDVWKKLKLHEVGIPCGKEHKNCKILITSREEAVCKAMKAEEIISVNPLPPEEAWMLFDRAVGKDKWNSKLKKVALDVVEECAGLPLFLEAVGNALKDKEIGIWKAALKQLRDPTDADLPYKNDGIMQLKLSYDHLRSDFDKSCFLLCSLFPEDFIFDHRGLTDLALALERFNNVDGNMQFQDVKSRVQLAMDSLKSSSLLLDVGGTDQGGSFFKMHDLVRDMAILIASEGDNPYFVESGKELREWQLGKHLESCKKICKQNKINKLLDHELHFPYLDTFIAANTSISVVPENFFEGMETLKVLDMSLNNISSLPRSLTKLKKLRTIDLNTNKLLREVSVLGELTCLVILRLRATGITNIPKEIGQLNNLRLLDVYNCEDLSYVTSGVISKLIRLEELYVSIKKEGDCSFLVELSVLKSLKILHLQLPELHNIPEDFPFESLIQYDIRKDAQYYFDNEGLVNINRMLSIAQDSYPLKILIMRLIQASDMLQLSGIKDLGNILPDLYPTAGSEELKIVILKNCENVTCFAKTCGMESSLSSKGKEFRYMGSFSNLRAIVIEGCSSLSELFPSSVAQGLVNLRYLEIGWCESLVVVISAGDKQTTDAERGKTELVTQDNEVVFRQLESISFEGLPKLECFYSGNSIMRYPSLMYIGVEDCGSMKRWSYGENDMPPNIKFVDDKGRPHSNIDEYIAGQQHKYKRELDVSAED